MTAGVVDELNYSTALHLADQFEHAVTAADWVDYPMTVGFAV